MSSTMRALLGLVAAGAICVAAAGCGSGGNGGNGGSGGNGGGGTTGGGDPLASMSAKQIMTKAISDLRSQPSFRLTGLVNTNGGINVNLLYAHGTSCKGTLTVGSKGGLELLVIGKTAWIRPNAKFWQSYAGSSASALVARLNGKYLKAPAHNANVSSLTEICSVKALTSSLIAAKHVTKGSKTTIDGQQAVALVNAAKKATLYVSDTSDPQVLRVQSTKSGNSGKVDFTDYGTSAAITPPPASQTVNGARYGF